MRTLQGLHAILITPHSLGKGVERPSTGWRAQSRQVGSAGIRNKDRPRGAVCVSVVSPDSAFLTHPTEGTCCTTVLRRAC